ncbi:MAG: hydroxymethylbilane synthase [Kiloniellales bacterium]|nr:hydroxymethylbilane synthase [Kiloniellales bacterium]
MAGNPPLLRIGTRGSPLALAQAQETKARLGRVHRELRVEGAIEIVVIKTTGDKIQDRALMEIGGKGLFTKEIEEALLEDRIDIAVHSMKDMPTVLPAGLAIPCILEREDPRDAWFSRDGKGLADLAGGAVVGTASLRRQAQIKHHRPDLKVVTLRGNVGTRLMKLERGEVDATILALAGLNRLGKADLATAVMSREEMLPAVAQGAIGLEVRLDDTGTKELIQPLNHADSAICVAAERALLAELDGSCRTPIAAFAELKEGGLISISSLVAAPDGSRIFTDLREGKDGEEVGRASGRILKEKAGSAFFAMLTGKH